MTCVHLMKNNESSSFLQPIILLLNFFSTFVQLTCVVKIVYDEMAFHENTTSVTTSVTTSDTDGNQNM